uniref:Response regulator n=1 Tax=Geobacter metallireducens TaxID=28232 RepID=A0A831UC01_GEOME
MESMEILLVEDNADDEFLALRALRRQGMDKVVVARDGQEALAYLLGPGCPERGGGLLAPAFILLDLKLPKVNGIEVLRALRADERTRGIPVIVISSSREESDLKSCRELDVLCCLTKPVDGKEIVGILGGAGLLDAPPS